MAGELLRFPLALEALLLSFSACTTLLNTVRMGSHQEAGVGVRVGFKSDRLDFDVTG